MSSKYVYMATIVPLSVIIPLIVGFLKINKLNKPLKIAVCYLLLSGFGNLLSHLTQHVNNMPALHIYTVVEFLMLSLFYRAVFKNKNTINAITLLLAAFIVFCIINSLFIQTIYTYNSYSRSIESMLLIIYAIYFFKHSLDIYPNEYENQTTLLYINSAVLIYFGGSFSLFTTVNLLRSNKTLNLYFWDIHATLVLIMYLLFAIGLLHVKKLR